MTPRTNPITFFFLSAFLLAFYALNFYIIIFEGFHSLNQGLTGTIVGGWNACFFHFVMRDSIFKHFTRLTYKLGILSGKQALLYCLYATCISLFVIATICIIAGIMMPRSSFEQEWLENVRDICGFDIPVDENGLLVFDTE